MVRRASLSLMALLLVAGCGGTDEEPAGLAETQSAVTESDEAAGGGGESGSSTTATTAATEEAEDDTDASPTMADDRSAYGLDPVEGRDDGQSVHDLIIDLHGPTDDVAAQANRLTSFPGIPTPDGGAVITEIMTLQDPADVTDLADVSAVLSYTRLSFYSSSSTEELILLYSEAYEMWGYTKVKTSEESSDAAVSTTLMLELGEEPTRPTAEVTITDETDTELTLVKIVQRERTDGGDRYLALAEWTVPYAPPEAMLAGVQVGSSYSKLDTFVSSQVQLEAAWQLPDLSQEETTALVQEVAAAKGVEFETNSTGAAVFAGPNDRINLTGNNGSMRVDIVYGLTDLVGLVESIG